VLSFPMVLPVVECMTVKESPGKFITIFKNGGTKGKLRHLLLGGGKAEGGEDSWRWLVCGHLL